MKITAGGMTYVAEFPVSVGDTVELPPTPYRDGSWTAEVTEAPALNPYLGHCKAAIRNLGSPEEMQQREVKALEAEARRVRQELKEARAKLAGMRVAA